MVKKTNTKTGASEKAPKISELIIDSICVEDSDNGNGKYTRSVLVNSTNVATLDKALADYATKLDKDKRKNATKMLQLAELSKNLPSNTSKKRIYSKALLNEVKMLPHYDRKEKAYTHTSVRISVAQFAKDCYNLIVMELNNKNGNNTKTTDLIK